MAPKQKGGGSAPKKHSVADEVEETLQAVVRGLYSCTWGLPGACLGPEAWGEGEARGIEQWADDAV